MGKIKPKYDPCTYDVVEVMNKHFNRPIADKLVVNNMVELFRKMYDEEKLKNGDVYGSYFDWRKGK